MNRIALRTNIALIVALLLLAGLVFFIVEYTMESEKWVMTEGSPHVYNGKVNINTGVAVDRDNTILLDMRDGRKYSNVAAIRASTIHWVGDRSGNVIAPALGEYASDIVGYDGFNGLYSYGKTGGVAQMTLSAEVQAAALEAMADHKGTVAVYNYRTGELICSVSTPTFDPDNAPVITEENQDQYDSIYYNRFTQGRYIPGSIFKIVTLAAALEEISDIRQQTFMCRGEYKIGNKTIQCDGVHWEQNLQMAFRNSCNCAFAQISEQLGGETLRRYVEQFGLTESIHFDGITTNAGSYSIEDEDGNGNMYEVAWSSIGQYKDQINPCSFMTFVGAIANGGQVVYPYVIEEVSCDGTVSYSATTVKGERIMSPETADIVEEFMGFNVSDKYGAENFPGLTVAAKTGTGEVGGDKRPNAMLAGFVMDEEYPLAFIVAVEDGGYGKPVCVPIISKILAKCTEVLD